MSHNNYPITKIGTYLTFRNTNPSNHILTCTITTMRNFDSVPIPALFTVKDP